LSNGVLELLNPRCSVGISFEHILLEIILLKFYFDMAILIS